MKKVFIIFFFICILFSYSFTVHAESTTSLTEDTYLDAVLDAIPEEVRPYVEDKYTSENLSLRPLITISEQLLKKGIERFITLLSKLAGLIIFAAILRKVNDAFSKGKSICELLSFLMILLFLITELLTLTQDTKEYCIKIKSFMSVVCASIGSVMAIGGNAISASSMTVTVTTISLLLENVCISILLPVIKLCLVSMISSFADKNGLKALGKLSRNFFQWLIGLVSFVSVTVFTYQSIISQAEDSVSASALRYAINGSIPVVGGAVGDSLRTITSSVNMIRSSIGTLGVITLFVYSLIPVFSLLSLKFSVSIIEELSDALSLDREKALLCEARKLLNMLIAVIAIVTLLYIFTLSVFMIIPLANS